MELIRLGGCAGWSVPLLFAYPEDRFSRVEAHVYRGWRMRWLQMTGALLHNIGTNTATYYHIGPRREKTYLQDF